jgi:excisionase family DNA binding protein
VDTAELVDIQEAKRITGLDPQTLYRLARQGRIRAFTVLRRARRFSRVDLQSLIRPHQPTNKQKAGTLR